MSAICERIRARACSSIGPRRDAEERGALRVVGLPPAGQQVDARRDRREIRHERFHTAGSIGRQPRHLAPTTLRRRA